MLRYFTAAFLGVMTVLVSGSAHADVSPAGGCGGGGRDHVLPCTAEYWSGQQGQTCQECPIGDGACTAPLSEAGYTVQCGDESGIEVWCTGGTASRAQPDDMLRLAGAFAIVGVWAAVRLLRRRR